MSGQNDFDETSNRYTNAPYTPRHPVPTIGGYGAIQEERHAADIKAKGQHSAGESGLQTIIKSVKTHVGLSEEKSSNEEQPYKSENHNAELPDSENGGIYKDDQGSLQVDGNGRKAEEQNGGESTETTANEQDARKKRRNMKHMKRDTTGREVTDPVTHLPVVIHDSTSKELHKVPENNPHPDSTTRRRSGRIKDASKSKTQLNKEREQIRSEHRGMKRLFPPPHFDATQLELTEVYTRAITFGLVSTGSTMILMLIAAHSLIGGGEGTSSSFFLVYLGIVLMVGFSIGTGLILGVRAWVGKRVGDLWEDQVWEAAKEEEEDDGSPTPESTKWLNSLLSSVWPLINPDLFTSLADTLEDVMQASLPKLVRMISVEDLGQGSESIRILGIRWLPSGAAAENISVDGKKKSGKKKSGKRNGRSDRKVPGEGELEDDSRSNGGSDGDHSTLSDENEDGGDGENIAEGMEAEEGDFVNMEVAFSYRASSSGKSLRIKSKNAHLYLAFYLPGGIRFPVWVELRGMIGTMRMRLQLCPDPPFFALCTLTLLGQPKADLSCVPLTKKGLNIMNLPIISSFVQSSIDAALAEYVAPKSLTLDLKDMLVGDDFKKDTNARGVIIIRIKSAKGFKEGDSSIGPLKMGSSDPYVAVGWAKFGKPVWSTRVIIEEMEPIWEETTFILVGPEELNAEERLRLQLWDSDRASADDDLGRIEVALKELMHSKESKDRMTDRHDGFFAVDSNEKMPGSLDWSVGYFAKTRIQDEQLKRQSQDTGISTMQQLKDKVSEETKQKMREATSKNESIEFDQQKAQDLKVREDDMIISSPPSNSYPSGIFSIQIHQITGLGYEKLNKNRQSHVDDDSDEEEGAGDLPSSYCTVILNHQKVFKTRTKPKNSKPFFNAGTEHLIRDWRTTEVIVSVRDARIHENNPLLGIVYLRLSHVFRERSQIIENFPLIGGIGYGRVRISMVFRSIQLQAPKELLGWDYGTLEVTGPITSDDIDPDLRGLRLKIRTTVHRAKMYSSSNTDGEEGGAKWAGKKDRPVRLAVRKRYSSCLVVEFRKNSLGLDKTMGFSTLWLQDIPDDEGRVVTLTVWAGDNDMARAEKNCISEVGARVLGHIKIPLKLWHGISGYHHGLVSKSPNMQEVVEALDTATANREAMNTIDEGDDDQGGSSSSSSSSSSSDSSDEEDNNEDHGHHHHHRNVKKVMKAKKKKISKALRKNGEEGEDDDGKRGPVDQLLEYKDHSDQLHRRNRGIMQWKGAQTANWMKTKVQHGKTHVLDTFKHHERDPGVETEV